MAKVQKNPRFSYSLIFRRKDVLSVGCLTVANCYEKDAVFAQKPSSLLEK